MKNKKIKRFACVALAISVIVSGLQVQPKKVQASTEMESDTELEMDKKAMDFRVEQATEKTILEGNVPESTDVKVTDVHFDDDSMEEVVSDSSQIMVSLEDGYIYKLGENVLNVTYMGYTKKVTIYAEPDTVVSMSAEQSNYAICSGDTLSQSDFDVVAFYSSGKIDSNYIDYEIVDEVVTDTTKSVILRNPNGVEAVVDLKISQLEPKSIVASYNGKTVYEGSEVDKDNLVVTLIYNNGKESVLEKDAYDLVYDEIVGGRLNLVEVVYKANPDILDTIYVTGVIDAATESPVPTTTPDGGATDKETTEPDVTPDATSGETNSTESPVEPQNTISVPSTTVPAQTASATAIVAASATPSAVASTTPGAIATDDNGKLPGDNSTTGSAVTSTSAIPVNTDTPSNEVPLKSSKVSLTVGVGEKITVTMEDAAVVTYKTSNNKILTVTDKGVVKAKKVGKAKVTATDEKGNTKIYTVTVKKAPKKVKVNFTKKTLKKGKKATIKVRFAKGYYSSTNTFKSSNKKVATVNSKGVITAKKKGICRITVKTFNGKKAVIKITVK